MHEVCVVGFWMGQYEVTQGEWKQGGWKKVTERYPSIFSNRGDDYPVENVSWDYAQGFIQWLNSKSGQGYRLPTEAEWEYAARSGGRKEKYSGGGSIDEVAWYASNSGKRTHPVGTKAPNGLGIYDMTGNVWEWCGDWFGEDYYSKSPRKNPTGPSFHSIPWAHPCRVLRGGSWKDGAWESRCTFRGRGIPKGESSYSIDSHTGLRLLRPNP